jgi:NAD(P)-dependent dehydrogenase (short-subunit alcohol dehydrogenase family)
MEGKTVLITGGFTGIGAATARRFSSIEGARVIATGLPASEPVREHGIEYAHLDVTSTSEVQAFIGNLPTLDVLVNCAGIIQRDLEFEPDVFEHVLDVNVTGTMRTCTAARKLLAASKGSIVNTASMLSYFGGPRVPAYSASKGGVAQLTRALAVAWAQQGIRVNAVAPGWIATPFTQALQEDPARSQSILDRTPMQRWGKPEEIAEAIYFLSTPAASFITGAVIPVDGGYSAA